MKTEIKRDHLNIRNNEIVVASIKKTFDQIDMYVKHNEYRLSKENSITDNELKEALVNASLRKKKVLRRYMYRIQHHATIRTINKFFHFLIKKLLKKDFSIKVLKSEHELLIEKKKVSYNEALKLMILARDEYRNAKGDFYKKD